MFFYQREGVGLEEIAKGFVKKKCILIVSFHVLTFNGMDLPRFLCLFCCALVALNKKVSLIFFLFLYTANF